jgi:hypothetical protein
MADIGTGGIRPQVDTRVSAYDNKDAKSQQSQTAGETPPKGDSVTLDNFVQQLVGRLKDFFKTDNLAGSQFAQTVTELSMRANVKQTFEGSVSVQGADGAKISAYSKQTSEVNVQIDIRMTQAKQVVAAQSAAIDQQNQFTPEATAQRIADFALSFFPMYASQHKDQTLEQQVDGYKKLVGGAIDQGFAEAGKILGDIPKGVSDQIQQTHDLVWQKLSSFSDYAKANPDKTQTAVSSGKWGDFVSGFFAQQQKDAKTAVADSGSQKQTDTTAGA